MSSVYDRSYIYGLRQAILQWRGPFFDALEVGGPGGQSCLTMQTILFGGKRLIAKRYEIGQIETIATVLLATY